MLTSKRELLAGTALVAGIIGAAQQAKADTVFTSFAYPATFPNGSSTTPSSQTTPVRAGTFINVKDFGAKGDGSTIDTTAIQAAINWTTGSATRCTIYFPLGIYLIDAPLAIPAGAASPNFILRGEPGATLESSGSGFHGYIIDGISNPYNPTGGVLVIENLAIINAYEGQNFTATASASWSAGSSVTITVVPPAGVAVNCLVYDLSGSSSGPKQTPVFVGVVTTVNAGTSVVVGTAAIAEKWAQLIICNSVQGLCCGRVILQPRHDYNHVGIGSRRAIRQRMPRLRLHVHSR